MLEININTIITFLNLTLLNVNSFFFHLTHSLLFQVKVRLQALMSALEISEPCNPSLHVEITAAISRLVPGSLNIQLIHLFQACLLRVAEHTASALGVFVSLSVCFYDASCPWDVPELFVSVLED